MPLPFLKNRDDAPAMPVESKDEDLDVLDAVASDMLDALKKGDKSMLKDALGALVDHIQAQDVIQDSLEGA